MNLENKELRYHHDEKLTLGWSIGLCMKCGHKASYDPGFFCPTGSRILSVNVPKDQLYPLKLKGVSICFSMLKAALSGSYVNFGVFRLYGDDALDNALNIYVELLLSVPQSDLLDYPKLSQTYYVLLECLAQDHISFLATMEPQVFLYILSSISEGLNALGAFLDPLTGRRVDSQSRQMFIVLVIKIFHVHKCLLMTVVSDVDGTTAPRRKPASCLTTLEEV